MAQYTRGFAKTVQLSLTAEWRDKVWSSGGKIYERRGDFRAISGGELPVIIHQGNRFDRKAGDKVELVETGILSVLEMTSAVQSLYCIDSLEQPILRLDLAADNDDVTVEWFRTNTYARAKREMREWNVQSISSNRSETLTAGKKPNQLRTYDKTGHRKVLLARENRKLPKEDKALGMTFEQRWGYSPEKIVTRVERQIGGAQIKSFGYSKVGNLFQLAKCDPFGQIVFPEDLPRKQRLKGLPAEHQIVAEYLRDFALRDGITNCKNELYRRCQYKTQFYRLWKRYAPFVMPLETVDGTTREKLHKAFLTSITKQLQHAA